MTLLEAVSLKNQLVHEMRAQQLGGTYDVTVPIYGNTSISFDTEAMALDAYGYFKQEVVKDLPLILLGTFSVVVLGVVAANLLVPPRPRA